MPLQQNWLLYARGKHCVQILNIYMTYISYKKKPHFRGAFSAYSAGNISLSRVRSPLGLLSYLFGRKLDFFTSKAAYIKSFSKDSVFNPFLKYFVSRRGWHLCVLMLEVCCIVGGGVGGFYAHLGLINWLCCSGLIQIDTSMRDNRPCLV